MKHHNYTSLIEWTGNKGSGTFDYRSYARSYSIKIVGKPDLLGSSDSSFRGEKHKHNPEDLFLASVSACHMLWYLHLCADAGVIVMKYTDEAQGTMNLDADGGGRFTSVVLYPTIVISDDSDMNLAHSLHTEANKKCFIANSCNFPISHKASISTLS